MKGTFHTNDCGSVESPTAHLIVTSSCPADVDESGAVGFGDLLIVPSAWGTSGPADPDGSGEVGFGDLLIVLSAWGPC